LRFGGMKMGKKANKPIYKNVWFLGVLVVILISIFFAWVYYTTNTLEIQYSCPPLFGELVADINKQITSETEASNAFADYLGKNISVLYREDKISGDYGWVAIDHGLIISPSGKIHKPQYCK